MFQLINDLLHNQPGLTGLTHLVAQVPCDLCAMNIYYTHLQSLEENSISEAGRILPHCIPELFLS